MSTFDACSIIEDFFEEHTEEQKIQAIASLVKSGVAYQLQGFYGRLAETMIEHGYITRDGEVLAY